MAIDEHIHRFSSTDYLDVASTGALARTRVELLDGLIVDMSPQGERHAFAIQSLSACYSGSPWSLRIQMPLELADGWVPEPDLAVTPLQRQFDRPPSAAFLVVEVSVSSLRRDLGKAAAYAAAGVPVYWIVDVAGGVVLEHAEPGATGYAVVRTLRGDDVLDAGVDGMAPVPVARLFAP